MESRVLWQSLHLKHLRCHCLPLARHSSAANTTPPQRGQPWPGGALMAAVSITVVLGAASLFDHMTEWNEQEIVLQKQKRSYEMTEVGACSTDTGITKLSTVQLTGFVPLPFHIHCIGHKSKKRSPSVPYPSGTKALSVASYIHTINFKIVQSTAAYHRARYLPVRISGVTLQSATSLTVAVTLGSKLLAVTH